MTPEILLYSRRYFNFLEPEKHRFYIEDIAHSLSLTNRFSGHTQNAYSVAQHSILCSRICPEEYALEKLMHDAAEAYLGDIASPLKQLLPEYKVIEERVERAIAKQFNLAYPFPKCVKEVDMIMLRTEFEDVVGGNMPDICKNIERAEFKIEPSRNPCDVEMEFLLRYYELVLKKKEA